MGGAFLLPCILTRCRAFVLSRCNTATHKRLQRILYRKCNYITNTAKRRTGLYSGVSFDCTRSTAHDTRQTQQAIAPPATRWRAYTRPDAPNRYQIPPPRWDAAQVSTAAYYNNVYKKVQGCAPVVGPCQTVQHIADHASPAGSAPAVCGSLASADTLSAVQQQEGGGRSGTIDGYRRISFRAVA